jgi:hypothetical protein
MQPPAPPNAAAVEVVATQPTDADNAARAHLSRTADRPLAPVTYLVKVRLDPIPPATSLGWALYVNDFRIPKYWEYKDGIYFKIFDPQFFSDHQGQALRFSHNGTEFIDTGLVLPQPDVGPQASSTEAADLPKQADALG